MQQATIFKNLTKPSKNPARTWLKLLFFCTLATILVASSLGSRGKKMQPPTNTVIQSTHPIIQSACAGALYPSLCFTSLSGFEASTATATFHRIVKITVNETIRSVANARMEIRGFLVLQDLVPQETTALQDCLDLLDQTLYELGQVIVHLHRIPDSTATPAGVVRLHYLYDQVKTLLSAAMTNEDTCINGLFDLDESYQKKRRRLTQDLQNLLTPITRMISNCLFIITNPQETTLKVRPNVVRRISRRKRSSSGITLVRTWRKYTRPNITVAKDGSGDYGTIGEAIRMAPNGSTSRFLIKIKAGVYHETVEISREKVNVMLIGAGMTKTIITGSKNFADGFSTFNSATLSVAGDKFLARDLTVVNTAGPFKYQAVAARVTSNSAFYRCNFSSYQDTLFAHSFHQFYYKCTIKGTIDFIFGNAAAVFQNCLILVRKPIPGQRNMITAQGREDPNQNTGILLKNCTIVAAQEFSVSERKNVFTFLGRPWRNYSRTIVMKSYMGDLIHPQGWCRWDEHSNLETVEYIEYLNYGPGSDTRRRVNWGGYKKNCSQHFVNQLVENSSLYEI